MTKRGFTLAEMVAVVAILMILALVSTPFVKGYIDDAYDGKAKVFLRQLNEARLNFEKDYPGFTISGTLSELSEQDAGTCDVFTVYQGNPGHLALGPNELLRCHYIKFPTDLRGRYSFYINHFENNCSGESGVVAMECIDSSNKHFQECITIDNVGRYSDDSDD